MKKALLLAIASIVLLGGCSSHQQTTYTEVESEPIEDVQDVSMDQHQFQYVVDRIEDGVNGEQWVVVEVYDATTGEITMIDIKVEEGYIVD